MHDSARKTDSRTDVARTIGILVLLAVILFAAGLCTASPLGDNPVPVHLSWFVLAITAVIFLVVDTIDVRHF